MIKYIECPACHKPYVRVEVSSDDYKVITTGRPLSEMPCQVKCRNCLRKIKYDVVKIQKNV